MHHAGERVENITFLARLIKAFMIRCFLVVVGSVRMVSLVDVEGLGSSLEVVVTGHEGEDAIDFEVIVLVLDEEVGACGGCVVHSFCLFVSARRPFPFKCASSSLLILITGISERDIMESDVEGFRVTWDLLVPGFAVLCISPSSGSETWEISTSVALPSSSIPTKCDLS